MSDSATENPIQKASRTAALGGGDEEEGDQGIDQNEEEEEDEEEEADTPGSLTRAQKLAGMKAKTGTDDDLRVSTIRLSQVGNGTFKVSTKSVRDKLIALEEKNKSNRDIQRYVSSMEMITDPIYDYFDVWEEKDPSFKAWRDWLGEKMRNRGFNMKVGILTCVITIIIASASLGDGMGFYRILRDNVGNCVDSDTGDCSCIYASTCDVDWYASGTYFAYENQAGYYPGTSQAQMNHDDDFGIFVPPRVPYSTPLRDTCSQTYKALNTCMNGFNTALYNGIMLGVQCYFLFFLFSEFKQYIQNEKKFKERLEQRAEAKSFACSCCRYEDGRWCCEGDTERGTDWVSRFQRSSWLVTQMIFNLIPVVLAVVVMDLLGKCKLNGEGGCPVELEGIQQKVSDSIAGQVFIFFKELYGLYCSYQVFKEHDWGALPYEKYIAQKHYIDSLYKWRRTIRRHRTYYERIIDEDNVLSITCQVMPREAYYSKEELEEFNEVDERFTVGGSAMERPAHLVKLDPKHEILDGVLVKELTDGRGDWVFDWHKEEGTLYPVGKPPSPKELQAIEDWITEGMSDAEKAKRELDKINNAVDDSLTLPPKVGV